MKIAFLTAGGLAPCLSSSIGRLVEQYENILPNSEMIGYLNGYKGLLLGKSVQFSEEVKQNSHILYNFGGSPIGNSRVKLSNVKDCIKNGYIQDGEIPLEIAAKQLVKDGINILHTIGGDDTNTTAAELVNYLDDNGYDLTVVGLPKTVDNDVFPITQTLGAMTAAEQGALFFRNIVNENTTSNRHLIIHEIMGRNCGWLTAATALEYRNIIQKGIFLPELLVDKNRWSIDAVYIPEMEIDLPTEVDRLKQKLDEKDSVNIFLSEGAGLDEIISECQKRKISFLMGVFKPTNKISIKTHTKIGYRLLFTIFYNHQEGKEIVVILPFNLQGKFLAKFLKFFDTRIGNLIFAILFSLSQPFIKGLIAFDSQSMSKFDSGYAVSHYEKVSQTLSNIDKFN